MLNDSQGIVMHISSFHQHQFTDKRNSPNFVAGTEDTLYIRERISEAEITIWCSLSSAGEVREA